MLKRTRGKRASHAVGVEVQAATGGSGQRGQTPPPLLSNIFNVQCGVQSRYITSLYIHLNAPLLSSATGLQNGTDI
jgi:hypothetical protein